MNKTKWIWLTVLAIVIIAVGAYMVVAGIQNGGSSYQPQPANYYPTSSTPGTGGNQTSTIKPQPGGGKIVTSTTPTAAGPGQRCGGNMTTAPVCGAGYHCAPEPGSHLPFGDVGGICVAN